MNNVSKLKIIAGFTLLLIVLFCSLTFIYREVERLARSEEGGVQWTDSLITLLHEKDTNTIRMLQALSKANDDNLFSTSEIREIIAHRDTIVTIQRVQHRIIQHRDTLMTPPPEKKGFFRRLKEAFVPPKKDSLVRVKTTLEYATDTILDSYAPNDSLKERLQAVAEQEEARRTVIQQRNRNLKRMDQLLSARIDSLLKGHEQETLERARTETTYRQQVRQRSARTIGGIAIGAVILAAVFLILIGRDVTRSNRYRRELEEARKRAEDLLAIREKLMLAITHDFKAPLGSIIGYADLLARQTVDERQQVYLDNMKTSSEHLLKLVTDLLDFHRLDLHKAEVHRVTFNPARLLEEIRVSFEPLTAAKGLELCCHIDPVLDGTFSSDPLRLRQIVGNLLSNAVKFTDRGSVTLKADLIGRMLKVSVTDTGKGMQPADRQRIFHEFTRLPDAQGQEGFGLGLSIVRMLVQLLEGNICVESTPGQGSTFTVRIPLPPSTEPLPQPEEKTPEAPLPAPAATQVLIIDDDRIQLNLTAAMLAQSGIRTVCCLQVDEVIDALRDTAFDALLTDVQMPAINGFDLLRLLRSSNIPQAQTIPVIAVTARSDMQRDTFLEHGFAGCLHKPFSVAELLRELSSDKQPTAPSTGRQHPQPADTPDASATDTTPPRRFDALTAFSGDDTEAAHAILDSFATESRLNLDRLRRAVDSRNTEEAAAVAHKMIPLFTMIGASDIVPTLRKWEAKQTDIAPEEIGQALRLIEEVVGQARKAADSRQE